MKKIFFVVPFLLLSCGHLNQIPENTERQPAQERGGTNVGNDLMRKFESARARDEQKNAEKKPALRPPPTREEYINLRLDFALRNYGKKISRLEFISAPEIDNCNIEPAFKTGTTEQHCDVYAETDGKICHIHLVNLDNATVYGKSTGQLFNDQPDTVDCRNK